MESMFQQFKDIAEFRLVYIKEAHAADSRWAVGYAKDLGITEHDDYDERCESASKLLNDKSLTIPFLIDSMDDSVNKAYSAWPDRIYLVRTDGRLAVVAKRGPWGFKPALDEVRDWLEAFRTAGTEPELPDDASPAGEDVVVATVEDASTEESSDANDNEHGK